MADQSPRLVRVLLGCVPLAVAVLLAGCAGAGAPETDPGMQHVHGLAVDPSDGAVLVATHTGLFRVGDPGGGSPLPERVGDRRHDLMGMVVDGELLLASGHPDPRGDLPVHLGLVRSADAGRTWQPVSLLGEADFHALDARAGHLVGWDATTSFGPGERGRRPHVGGARPPSSRL